MAECMEGLGWCIKEHKKETNIKTAQQLTISLCFGQ